MADQVNSRNFPGFWRLFASMRLGLVLMFLLAGTATLGVLLPGGISGQGGLVGVVNKLLGLDAVFATWWFKGLGYLLAFNVLVCFINRIGAVLSVIRQPRMTISAIDRLKNYETFLSKEKPEEVLSRATQVLLANRFNVHQGQDEEQIFVYADKQRVAHLGPVLAHLGFLALLAGIIWWSLAGFERTLVAVKGDSVKLSQAAAGIGKPDQDYSLRLDDVKQLSPQPGIVDIHASVTLFSQDGSSLTSGEAGYNSSLRYSGVKVNLLRYEPTVLLNIDSNGQKSKVRVSNTQNNPIPVPGSDLLIAFSDIGTNKRSPTVKYSVIRIGNPVPLDQRVMGVGQTPVQLIQYPFSFSMEEYRDGVVLRVSENPGLGMLLGGTLTLLLGMWLSLTTRYRKIWISIIPEPEQVQVMVGGFTAKQKVIFNAEFNGLVEDIRGGV